MRTFTLTLLLAFSACFTFSQISTFPHLEDFDNGPACASICTQACQLTGSWRNASQVGVSGGQISWVSDANGTASSSTGPSVDHTQGNATGMYLYTESSGQCTQSTAMLISPWYDFTNLAVPELFFWYHMQGMSMGTMHVDVQVGSAAWTLDVVPAWTDNDTVWKSRSVLANGQGNQDSVRFRIRGITGTSFTSDMAIDDIRVGPPPTCDVSVIASNVQNGTGLSANQPISITVENLGADTLFAGDTIPVCYQRDNLSIVCENLILANDVGFGGTVLYHFAQPADLSGPTFIFKAWTGLGCDQVPANDQLLINITNNLTPYPCDVEVLSSNVEIGYGLTDTQTVSIVVRTNGSDTLFAGDTIPVCYQVINQTMVCEDFVLPQNLVSGDTLTYTFSTLADLSDFQFTFWAWTALPCDSNSGNDTLTFVGTANYPPAFTCAYMWVDISTGPLRPCRTSSVWVSYENQGIDTAFNVSIKVGIDTSIVTLDSTYTSTWGVYPDSIFGDTLCFNIGTVNPFQSRSSFRFYVEPDCDTNIVGLTFCAGAHIYPDTFCTPPNLNWDHSSVSVFGECISDSLVCFTVSNTGSATNGNMAGPTDWRMYVNNQLAQSGTMQLCGGCDTVLCWQGGGNTIRLEVDQRPGHPGNSHPNASIESCGNPNQIIGMVNQLNPDDGDHFVEIHCRQIVLSYDPNEKSVIPSGTQIGHIVAPNSELEYTINFQNTGNDTAFVVAIYDTLSSNLDTSTVQFGTMSHHGTAVQNGYYLSWTFPNILLPDSTTNEPGSHGVVSFKVSPVAGLPDGTVINNDAAIVFDINTPVITNNTFVTLGNPIQLSEEPSVFESDLGIQVWPNPSTDAFHVQVESLKSGQPFEVEVFDLMGNLISTQAGNGPVPVTVNRNGVQSGIYLYLIKSQGQLLGAGKLIRQ